MATFYKNPANLDNSSTFLKSERGAALVLFALLAVPITLLTAMAIETSRQAYINTQLAYACDAAAIAGARYELADLETNALKVFYANYPQNDKNIKLTPTVKISDDKKFISVSVNSQMPTFFSGVAGIGSLKVSAYSQVRRNIANLEVAMVLDVTGSMASNNKIDGLRTAAKKLINEIYEGSKSRENTAVSIVPYVATVNVGSQYTDWISNPVVLNSFPKKETWKGCVYATDTGATKDTDDAPSATRKWPVYFVPSTLDVYGKNKKGDNDWKDNKGTVQVVNPISGVDSIGPNRSCGPTIMPLTNDSDALIAKINTLQPIPGGGTFGNFGLIWGWNTISPKWIGKWQSAINPKPYGVDTTKSIVIVTDGENQWFDQTGYEPTGDPTAYGRVSDGKLGVTSISNTRAKIDERLLDICTKIKAAGIQIFTVTFQVSDTYAKTLYQTCATKPEWSFQAENSQQLTEQFSLIAGQIKQITIVK